jgi:hypothetical protein
MATPKKTNSDQSNDLELRKVKALERISDSLEDISAWIEDIDKDDWSNRIQYYLTEFHDLSKSRNSKLNDSEE